MVTPVESMMQTELRQSAAGPTTTDRSGTDNPPGSAWSRLRQNLERNRGTFQKSGISEDDIPTAECRCCGTMESVMFWSVQSSRRETLTLRCPYCERGQAYYKLGKNEVRSAGERTGAIKLVSWSAVGIFLLLFTVVYFQGQDIVRLLETGWNRMAGAAPAAVSAPRVQWDGPAWEVPTFTDRFDGLWRRSPAVGVAAPAGSHVFVAFGDRVGEVESVLREAGAASAVLDLRYLEEQGVTRLIINAGAADLAERFDELSEWERLPYEVTG